MNIIGAGLSGLICGALNAQSRIYERNQSDFVSHRAVLRFRDDRIARALGLTFRKVTVRKAIWVDGAETAPTPRWANYYSRKARQVYADNSIWNVAPAERFIAPDDLHSILANICDNRVTWGAEINGDSLRELCETRGPLISTIPLPTTLHLIGWRQPFKFTYSPILVDRYRVTDCDLFQTVYFPDPLLGIYRATLTGELLTIEAGGERPFISNSEFQAVVYAFGLNSASIEPILANHRQSFGKIAPAPDGERKYLLHAMTTELGIYSLGRFATWRNILLDDIYDDIGAIRKMLTQSNYDLSIERLK